MGIAADNEKRKATATFLNTIATLIVSTAVVVPAYNLFSDTTQRVFDRINNMSWGDRLDIGVGILMFVGIGVIIHGLARAVLSGLQDEVKTPTTKTETNTLLE